MIRDRIKSLRRVKSSDLKPSPKNWRTHPEAQREALSGILSEVGYADALLARELPDGSLELVDGHLRADLDPDQKVPVLILDITEEEADKILLTLDPLAAMAEADTDKLTELLAGVETESTGLAEMLEGLAVPELGENDPDAEWEGMPEFVHEDKTAFRSLVIHFKNQEEVDKFAASVPDNVTPKTRMVWWSGIEIEAIADQRYA